MRRRTDGTSSLSIASSVGTVESTVTRSLFRTWYPGSMVTRIGVPKVCPSSPEMRRSTCKSEGEFFTIVLGDTPGNPQLTVLDVLPSTPVNLPANA